MNRVTAAIAAVLLLIFVALTWLAFHFHGNAVKAGEQVKQQENTLAQQSGLISTLQEQDRKSRALAAEQQQREQQLRQQGEIYQRKYQDAIKNNKCAAERMPDAVLELLR
jgi:predicted PurR-regulated permease PerM